MHNGLARTPPLGWNSWNRFGCDINEGLIRETADAIVVSGMREAGYAYVIIDDCWQIDRAGDGTIVADPQRFPAGIEAVAGYVHARGLKFGIYTCAGAKTCEGRPGGLGHEEQDARTYAAWGVDYVKVDWCYSQGLDARTQYSKWNDALARAGRPIVFSVCNWGGDAPWLWAPNIAHLWRTTTDIKDKWESVLQILDINAPLAPFAGPGGWNDPDMLEVGNGGMTETEYRAHFSLWAIMAAPLIAGNDLRSMAESTRGILTNSEVIAVDQDPLGMQGTVVSEQAPGLQVWSKRMRGKGERAVVLFNRTSEEHDIRVSWSDIGLADGPASIRDLWTHSDLGSVRGEYSASVPPHGAVMLKMSGLERGAEPPSARHR